MKRLLFFLILALSAHGQILSGILAGSSAAAAGCAAGVTDNFNRADAANLGANWTVTTGKDPIKIVTNQAESTSTGGSIALEFYSATSFVACANQYAQGKIVALAASGNNGPGCRVDTGGTYTGYFADVAGTNSLLLLKVVAGSVSVFATSGATTNPGDTVKITCTGGATTSIQVLVNGVAATFGAPCSGTTCADSSSPITAGAPGWIISDSVSLSNTIFDDFAAGIFP